MLSNAEAVNHALYLGFSRSGTAIHQYEDISHLAKVIATDSRERLSLGLIAPCPTAKRK
jgi:hypothetical protein